MAVLLIAAVALAGLVLLGRGKRVLTRGEWRVGAGLVGVCALAGAALVGLKGSWENAFALAVLGALMIAGARSRRGPYGRGEPKAASAMTEGEARALLGVSEAAGPEEIRAAYARLIARLHPDQGGTHALAAQINAARDRLLKR